MFANTMLYMLMLCLCCYREAEPLEWSLRAARDYLVMTAHHQVAGDAMPQLEAFVGGPRRALTKVEQDLVSQFSRHQLGDALNGEVYTGTQIPRKP